MKLRLSAPEQLGRPRRHQGTHRHQEGWRCASPSVPCRATSTWPTTPSVKAAFPALADLASRIGDRQVRAMGTIGGSVANNDPAACYPSAVLGSGATVITYQARDRGRRLLPGPVHHGARGRRADHRDPLPDPEARGLREAAPEGLALPAGRRVPRAVRQRRARGHHRRGQRRVPARGARGCAQQGASPPRAAAGVKIDASELNSRPARHGRLPRQPDQRADAARGDEGVGLTRTG